MKRNLRHLATWVILPLLALAMAGCGEEDGGEDTTGLTRLGGTLSSRTLTAGEGPYLMDRDVLVPEGTTVTIEPGTEIRVDGKYAFEVHGVLDARGTEDDFIHFTSNLSPSQKGDWKGIWLIGADDASILEYVRVSWANKYDLFEDTSRTYLPGMDRGIIDTVLHRGAVTIRDCSPAVRRCIIDNGGYDGIQVIGESNPDIQFNTIVQNAFNGIRIEPAWDRYPDLVYGTPVIENNIIEENDDAGVRVPSDADLAAIPASIHYNDIWNNATLSFVPPEFGENPGVRNNISDNPRFIDPDNGDFHLHPCSAAIDAGDESAPLDPDGTVADLGALAYFQAENELAKTLRVDELTDDFDFYWVTCDVVVPEGHTLTIQPGVELRFVEPFSFIVRGKLIAQGTPSRPIRFTSAQEEPRPGDWRQLLFDEAENGSLLENVIIEYGSVENVATPDTVGALSLSGSSPTLRNVTIRRSMHTGLYCFNGSSPVVEGIEVDGAGVAGIACELNSNPTITGAVIHDIQGYGLRIESNSSPVVNKLLIYDVGVSGIVALTLCSPEINYATVYAPPFNGMRVEEFCLPRVRNSIFAEFGGIGVEASVSSQISVYNSVIYSTAVDAENFISRDVVENAVLHTDPRFVDPEEGDFHLRSDSPAAGTSSDGTNPGYYGYPE